MSSDILHALLICTMFMMSRKPYIYYMLLAIDKHDACFILWLPSSSPLRRLRALVFLLLPIFPRYPVFSLLFPFQNLTLCRKRFCVCICVRVWFCYCLGSLAHWKRFMLYVWIILARTLVLYIALNVIQVPYGKREMHCL